MTAQPDTIAPTQDERLLAALAHVFGLVVALIIWATQKNKSRFVRFQAMQAVAFDVVLFVVFFLAVGCTMITMFGGTLLGVAGAAAASADETAAGGILGLLFSLTFIIPFAGTCVMFFLAIGALAGRAVAAINAYQGRNYHHPWLGERVEKMLK
jgi:uncharacterized Tic20 family protein